MKKTKFTLMDTNRLGIMPEPKLSKESEHNLVFKPITLDSLSEIEPFLHRQCYRTCDFSIGGIYMWVDYFGYEYCISQDRWKLHQCGGP
jgi:hypothetical protein